MHRSLEVHLGLGQVVALCPVRSGIASDSSLHIKVLLQISHDMIPTDVPVAVHVAVAL